MGCSKRHISFVHRLVGQLQCTSLFGWSKLGTILGLEYLSAIKNATVQALEQQGFNVTSVGDTPNDLSSYNLVVFEA